MVLISERPAEVDDRAVSGHWAGDLVLGSNCRSAIATLVARQSRYTLLVHLPNDHGAIAVRERLVKTINALPEHVRKSLTWDQGAELAQHRRITLATKWISISATRIRPGSVEPTRTPMDSFANTSPRARICLCKRRID